MKITLSKILTSVLVVAAGYLLLQWVAPGEAARVRNYVSDKTAWSAEACKADPLGCLDAKTEQLAQLEVQVVDSLETLRAEKVRVEAVVEEQVLLQAKNQAFLEQGKQAYQKYQANSGQTIMFAGRKYPDLDTLKLQLELLFKEQAFRQASVENAKQLKERLKERLDQLKLKQTEIRQQIALIPTQRELLRVDQAFARVAGTMQSIERVLHGGQAVIKDDAQLIGTTRDLMARLQTRGSSVNVVDEAFESFLKKQSDTAQQAATE